MQCRVLYFKTSRGDQPVQTYLNKLSDKDAARIFASIHELATEGVLSMPHSKKLTGLKNLYEIRYRRHRVIYCYYKNDVVLLHAFMKKTQRTSQKDLALAQERQRKIKENTL